MAHERHRARMRKKLQSGTRLEDHELLEMLLFYSLPRINTNELAHRLICACGSLGGVFSKDTGRLTAVKGIGEGSATLCTLIGETVRRCILELCDTRKLLSSPCELNKFFCALFFGIQEEQAYVIGFNARGKLLAAVRIGDGIYDEGTIQAKRAIVKLCRLECKNAIIVHNHPSGILKASDMDAVTAEKLDTLFGRAGIKIRGHYVYAGGGHVQFAPAGKELKVEN